MILIFLTLIICTAAITKLICDYKHEDEIISLKGHIKLLSDEVSFLKNTNEIQKKTIEAFQNKTKTLVLAEKELARKSDEIEMLNDLIAKLTASPYNPKERIPPGNTDWF